MFYRYLRRIFRKHALFHLLIPLAVGVVVESVFANLADGVPWSAIPHELLSGHHLALYAGVFLTYIAVIGILIKSETNIGLRHIELVVLAEKMKGTQSLFAVATA